MNEVGVTTKKNIIPITIGDMMFPSNIPILNHILFKGVNSFEFIIPKNKKINEITNDQYLISLSFISGQVAIIKKTIKKTIPKLLFEPILILLFFTDQLLDFCGLMSFLLIPATFTGFFIASLLNGSPNSWLRIISINVVIPCF